jgi:hypothetical protein
LFWSKGISDIVFRDSLACRVALVLNNLSQLVYRAAREFGLPASPSAVNGGVEAVFWRI